MSKPKELRRSAHATPINVSVSSRPAIPKSKKERPASKGRVHKGRTRN